MRFFILAWIIYQKYGIIRKNIDRTGENMTDLARNCPYFKKCGACQTLNLTYEEELSLKMKREIALLGRFAHVEEILPM